MHDSARRNLSLNLFILYQILLCPIIILILIGFAFIKRVRKGLLRRFSLSKLKYSGKAVIIHSSSLGEAKMAVKLARLIKNIKPDMNIIGSSFTLDGLDVIRDEGAFTEAFLYPVDIFPLIYLKLRKINPISIIFIEADLWPSLLYWGRRKNARIIVLSGRTTEKARRLMGVFRPIVLELYRNVDRIFTANKVEYEKLRALGINPQKMIVSGSIKYMDNLTNGKNIHNNIKNKMKKELYVGDSDKILVAGSTHKGEEDIILTVYKNIRKRHENLRLIIAPRYIERSEEIINIAHKNELKAVKFSILDKNIRDWDVLVVDKIGILSDIYSIAYIVFVGGTLVKRGGQNIMEPAKYGVPVLFGPSISNFTYEAYALIKNSGGKIVRNISELESSIYELLEDKTLYERFSKGSSRSYISMAFDVKLPLNEVNRWT
jgi:3-deoxy-D-manno-octulosonic-acid transferase